MRSELVALYIDPRGPYPGLVAECYDAERDAKKYNGPLPVVAHPPCGPWGMLRHLSKYQDADCGPRAVEQVRAYGGVLEHPHGSKLYEHCGLPKPGQPPDAWGGFSVEVCQVDWGHVARKRTWLYVVGCRPTDLPPNPAPREPTHWTSGGRVHRPGRSDSGLVPSGIKICSAEQRRRTPIAFAEFLLTIAEKCSRINSVRP